MRVQLWVTESRVPVIEGGRDHPNHVSLSNGAAARTDSTARGRYFALDEVEHFGDRSMVGLDDESLCAFIRDPPKRRHRFRDAEGQVVSGVGAPSRKSVWSPDTSSCVSE